MGFNPLIMAAAAGSELLTDLPFWWGGAYIWATPAEESMQNRGR